jgi:hypothetical protein
MSFVKPVTKFEHNDGPLTIAKPGARQLKQLLTNQWSLSLKSGNNCIMTSDGCTAFVKNIVLVKEDITLVCTKFESVVDAFSYPLPSSKLSICQVEKQSSFLCNITLSDVLCKCVCLPVFKNTDCFLVIPYLH